MKKLIVNKKYDNKKLNKFLQNSFPEITNSLFYKTLRKKDIKINGKRISENVIVFENDEIEVYISDELLNSAQIRSTSKYNSCSSLGSGLNLNSNSNIKPFELNIIFEDENILVINKPSSLEVTGENSLTTLVHQKYANSSFLPMPCHRLDRNTTGLVLFAKNQESLDILLNKFKLHEIEKHYKALVYGIPKYPSQRLNAYLFKDSKKSLVYISDEPKKGYSKIITSYTVIQKNKNGSTLLDVQIETGKTHQIRAHLAHIGLPIIGDGKYGDYEINKKFGKKHQQLKSYKLKFNFITDSSILNYLNKKEITISK